MGASTAVVPRLDEQVLVEVVRSMFPHEGFPDGPYERTAAAIVEAAGEDARTAAQLEQGMAEVIAAGFAELDGHGRLEYLRSIDRTTFFETVRAKVILVLYNDPEVWSLLGYEGPAFAQGGYLTRGFDDLDWLPDPQLEASGA